MITDGNYYLAVHVETTGINQETDKKITDGHSIVALALVICDKEFNRVEDKIIFIDNGINDAELGTRWHGISNSFLKEEGVSEEDAVLQFANFILEYFSPEDDIVCLGQNPHSFALPFLKKLLYKHKVYINFSTNSLDLFSLTAPTMGELSIREVIDIFGDVDDLPTHYQQHEYCCLLKVISFIETFRRLKKAWISMTRKVKLKK